MAIGKRIVTCLPLKIRFIREAHFIGNLGYRKVSMLDIAQILLGHNSGYNTFSRFSSDGRTQLGQHNTSNWYVRDRA
ncbi:hypothetical protein [Sphingobacterium siyangense]|uniref:hypothetical protein n=1 Tax=Sphingobacterium siyangense TaxID=459529 RepID=UPI0019649102|nr:hypothetical protein [Sphingobacterium siyangense]QRY58286.1 hypothetical protein JVX97_02075 [Sphingobacterium siyangense]